MSKTPRARLIAIMAAVAYVLAMANPAVRASSHCLDQLVADNDACDDAYGES